MPMLFGNFARPLASVSAAFWNWLSAAYPAAWRMKNAVSADAVSSFTISSPMPSPPFTSLAAKCTSHWSFTSRGITGVVLDGVVDDRQRERCATAAGEHVHDLRLEARVVRVKRNEARQRFDLLVLHLFLGVRVGRKGERTLVVLVDVQDLLADRDHGVRTELLLVIDLRDADARHDRVRVRSDSFTSLGNRTSVVLGARQLDALLGWVDLLAGSFDGVGDTLRRIRHLRDLDRRERLDLRRDESAACWR